MSNKFLKTIALLSFLLGFAATTFGNGVPRGSNEVRSIAKYCENEQVKRESFGLVLSADCYANNGQLRWGTNLLLNKKVFDPDLYLEDCRNFRLQRRFILTAGCKQFRPNGKIYWERIRIDLNRIIIVKDSGELVYIDEYTNPTSCTDPEYYFDERLSSPPGTCRTDCECDGDRYCKERWCKDPQPYPSIVYPDTK